MQDEVRLKAAARVPELTLVLPTFNERENVVPLVELVAAALAGGPSCESAGPRELLC
jgi:hypothetical protein